jgi:nicotinamide-nucleotide amidase
MKAEILSIGDELLIGQTINTNASWIGVECSLRGIRIVKVTTIQDDKLAILKAVYEAMSFADVVFVTGGLGPTKDDITKHTLCEYFDTKLEIHPPTLRQIEHFFTSRNRPMLESNIRQAELPADCTILENKYGTAAGMWFEKEGKVLISMPGVPYEMKGIMTEQVFPRLIERYELKDLYHYTIQTQGIGESFLADKIQDWENRVRDLGFGLAYLPSPGMVKLRITSYEGESRKKEIQDLFEELRIRFPQFIFGDQDDNLPSVVGRLLKSVQKSVGTVESCSGGALAHSLVTIPGSSDYFMGSFLTYSNALKMQLADVNEADIKKYGAVSSQVVEQMAVNGKNKLGVDYCIATSGIAGPDGGSEEKPVGTIWVAIAFDNQAVSKMFQFGDNRERNIQMTVLSALNFLRCTILNISSEKK